ncbi:hypothetical protein AZE42_07231 [Rhizopogon vesiculosus]|uniref:Uncharacterized protein n=1 Tax=Rhizopogon vesiculosus TaxID=180088 RepID=A0A1J8QSJ9_9AGAM|nr:hypothetical protein AZE42_07231 [Rhizopogon vesiculosus]
MAKYIFEHEQDYTENWCRYRDAVGNRIEKLKKEWHDMYNKLHSTGAGVHPLDGDTDLNLHTEIIGRFPWFDDLHSVWKSNPSFVPPVVSSQPGVDHAAQFLSDIRNVTNSSSEGPCTQLDHWPSPSYHVHGGSSDSDLPQQFSYCPPSGTFVGGGASASPNYYGPSAHAGLQFGYSPSSGASVAGSSTGILPQYHHACPSSIHTTFPQHVQYPLHVQTSPQGGTTPMPPRYPPSNTHTMPPPSNIPTMPLNQGSSAEDLYDDPDDGALFSMDGVDEYRAEHDVNAVSMNSPPRAIGNKRQLASSPSPPPTSGPSFSVPQKPRTSSYNSRNTFKSVAGSAMYHGNKPSSAGSSTSSVHTPTMTSLLNAFDSPTSQTSLPKWPSKAPGKKCIRLDIDEQVDIVNQEIESLSSERLSRAEMKNEHAIAKLNQYHQEKEYQFMREEHVNDRHEAAVAHDHSQEAKDKDIQVNEAKAKLVALEVAALQLQIQLHALKKGDDADN